MMALSGGGTDASRRSVGRDCAAGWRLGVKRPNRSSLAGWVRGVGWL
jgi:hypothetical protein